MSQQDQWAEFRTGPAQSAPRPQSADPGIIYGRPAAPDAPTPFERNSESRAQEDQGLQREKFSNDKGKDYFDQTSKLRGEFGKLSFVKEYPTVARQYAYALQSSPTPSGDQALIVAYAKMLDPGSVVREAEFDTTAAADSAIGRTVSRIGRELGWKGGGRLSEEARNKVRSEMRTLVQQYDKQYSEARKRYAGYAGSYGFDPELIVGDDYSQTYADTINSYWEKQKPSGAKQPTNQDIYKNGVEFNDQKWLRDDVFDRSQYLKESGWGGGKEGLLLGFLRANKGNQDITAADVQAFHEANGIPIPPDPSNFEFSAQSLRDGDEILGVDTSIAKTAYINQLDEGLEDRGIRPENYGDTIGAKVAQGLALGFGDELQGVVGAAGALATGGDPIAAYGAERDMVRRQLDRSGEANPKIAIASELVGSLATGVGLVKSPLTMKAAAKQGAVFGGVGGFGYGDGAAGSTVNALAGATLGGVIGAGGQKVGNALASRAANRKTKPAGAVDANALAKAGEAEGVTVNRAMVEPAYGAKIKGVDATARGPQLRAGMDEVEGQIGDRVQALGQGGTAVDDGGIALGQTTREASERMIAQSGQRTKRAYDRAEKLSRGAVVEPTTSAAALDDILVKLKETPEINSGEIKFLESLRSDLGKNLSVGALRRIRTSLRKKINKGDLVFGEGEADVLAVMGSAADDIRNGLNAQGMAKAAQAFDEADNLYATRAGYIRDTLQKVIGRRQDNLPPEAVAKNLLALQQKDAQGFSRFFSGMESGEKADLAATIASKLGNDGNGNFSASVFLSSVTGERGRKFTNSTLKEVFGADGVQSINNLKLLSEQVKRVKGAYNHSNTGGANNYNGWLANSFLGLVGGGTGLAGGGTMTGMAGAAAGAGVGAGAKYLRDGRNVKILLSPKITRWVLNAPKTANPKAIDKHFSQLGNIAKAEPALAGEVEFLHKAILGAANDNAAKMSAAAEEPEQADEGPRYAVPE